MNILFIASEVEPFSKTGGLADVAAALPKALALAGHDVRVATPLYRDVARQRYEVRPTGTTVSVTVGTRTHKGCVWEAELPTATPSGKPKGRVAVYFIEQPELFERDGLYQVGGRDYPDNLARFSFFSQAALRMLPRLGWRPDVVHCHDWQTALVCAHLAMGAMGQDPWFAPLASVLTIHNLAYQGVFPGEQWEWTGLPASAFTIRGLEFYGQINCLKGGLLCARALTTVSPTYASEIRLAEFGCGLEGVLAQRGEDLIGILNGIDGEAWHPAADPHVACRYSVDEPAGKSLCKLALQQQQGLAERHDLLIGMIQRLAQQKGIDIVVQAIERLMALPLQMVILGTGDLVYHRQLEQLRDRFPGRLAVTLAFDDALAHRIEAGADAFLMPSRFEPCGLNQMYSMRYGTVPIVRRVGGLADTVVDVTPETVATDTATGFVFDAYTATALVDAVQRTVSAFCDQPLWTKLMRAGMQRDFSWDRSARAYEQVYERALAKKTARASSLEP